MPGYNIGRSGVKNPQLFDDCKCSYCHLLLKDAVQPNCGHHLCQSCAEELRSSSYVMHGISFKHTYMHAFTKRLSMLAFFVN